VDEQHIRREDLLILISRRGNYEELRKQYTGAGIGSADLFGPPVPLKYLISLVPRLLRTVFEFWLPAWSTHPLLSRRTAGAILYGLQLETFLHHYEIGVLLSAEEHSHQHVVETVTLNKFGGRTAWIPHTAFTNTGYPTAYFHYDLLPVQGWFPILTYGNTWSKRMVVKPVGIPTNDGANLSDEDLASQQVRRLIKELKASYKIVGVFTGSYTPDQFVMERNRRFLEVLAQLAEQRGGLRMVVKPKATPEWPENSYFLADEPFRSIIERGIKDQSIIILDPLKDLTCSAQYLIGVSDVVVSTGQYAAFGSVWLEALLLGKPSYVFAPSEFRSAPFADELFDRWLFDDEKKLVSMVIENLQNSEAHGVDERVKYLFDPFNDGRALERLRDEIVRIAKPDVSLEHPSIPAS
jgi:hypothetical protein